MKGNVKNPNSQKGKNPLRRFTCQSQNLNSKLTQILNRAESNNVTRFVLVTGNVNLDQAHFNININCYGCKKTFFIGMMITYKKLFKNNFSQSLLKRKRRNGSIHHGKTFWTITFHRNTRHLGSHGQRVNKNFFFQSQKTFWKELSIKIEWKSLERFCFCLSFALF